MPKLLLCADLHGNEVQIERLVKFAQDVDALLIGGDLTPRYSPVWLWEHNTNLVAETRRWFNEDFMPIIKRCTVPVYITFGNTDCRANVAYFMEKWNDDQVHIIESGVVPLHFRLPPTSGDQGWEEGEPWHLFALPYVPLSDHHLKDFERFDTVADSVVNYKRPERGFTVAHLNGEYSTEEGIARRKVSKESIESLLATYPLSDPSPGRCIWMTHAPPAQTNLDCIRKDCHVGSVAIREAIMQHQPLLSLHGHIHETVIVTGQFKDQLGETPCYSVGNNPWRSDPYCIKVDTDHPHRAERFKLTAESG